MNSIAMWPTLTVLVIASIADLRSRRIPNWLVIPFLLAGIAAGGWTGGLYGVARSLAGVALATILAGALCYLRSLGLGDLKLCAAVGAWIGPFQLIYALLATGIAGGVLALGYAAWYGSLGNSVAGAGRVMKHLAGSPWRPHSVVSLDNPAALRMPYAPAIAIGTMLSFYLM